MALTAKPGFGAVPVPIVLPYWPQITVDVADAAVKKKVPFPFTVVGVQGFARAAGGGTPFTDVDVDVYLGTTKIATLAIVDGSTLAGSGVQGTLLVSGASLDGAADAFLHLKLIDVTGGASTPTLDGLEVIVWIVPK